MKRAAPPHEEVAAGFARLQEAAATLADVYADARVLPTETPADYVSRYDAGAASFPYVALRNVLSRPGRYDAGLLNIVHAWASGVAFSELCGMCDLFEGSIIRAIRRLSELLDELKSAAKAIGNDELFGKFEQGCALIRRDIVFSASLYIEG